MQILIVGLGSMGKRRLRILKENFHEFSVSAVESREDRRLEISSDSSIVVYSNITDAFNDKKFDAVLICTSPLSHGEIASEALKNKSHVFCELNLDNSWYRNVADLARENKKHIFLSSTMLYHDDINWISSQIKKINSPCAYEYHVGQYLPDWHPWEKPEDYFISNVKTNGCRELLAIEMPWIDRVFSPIVSIKSFSAKVNKDLSLGWPDIRSMIICHKNGTIGTLIVDVVSRIPRRDFRVWGEWGDIAWGGKIGSLRQSIKGNEWKYIDTVTVDSSSKNGTDPEYKYANIVNEKPYVIEVADFVRLIQDKPTNIIPHTINDDLRILDNINKIEEASLEGI